MSCFFHFTLLVALALLSFCIQLAPAQSSPPPCTSYLDPLPSELTVLTDDDQYTLTLFKNLSLSLPTEHSLSFTIITSNADDEHEASASLAFILMRWASGRMPRMISMQSKELRLITYKKETRDQHGAPCSPRHKCSLDVCINDQKSEFQMLNNPMNCPSEQNSDHSDETEVSLSYDADAKQIQGQAVHASKLINQTFSFSTANESRLEPNERTTLFVGYITGGNATISVALDVYDDGKSNHKMVVVWVIVGVSVMVFLIGLLILVLFIAKRRGCPPSLVRSHPAARHGTLPSAPPFSHHDLESTATPMKKALPLSPPHTSAFQISGTATWLKQPNPR